MINKNRLRSGCLLIPAVMFLTAETVTGNLRFMTPVGVILNLLLYYLLYLGILAFFRTTKYGWPVLNLLLYVLVAAEYFVISFRQRPIMVWDVLALRTAMTVSANYNYVITPRLVATFLVMAAAGIVAWKFPIVLEKKARVALRLRKEAGNTRAVMVGPKGIWLLSAVVFFCGLFRIFVPAFQLDVHMWDPIINFEKEGFLLSTVISMKNLVPVKPDGYSSDVVEALLAEAGEGHGTVDGRELASDTQAKDALVTVSDGTQTGEVIPVNVICIMNESFADLNLYNELNEETSFETDMEYLPYFHGLTENTQKGDLYVPVFGAMTPNSEYEFLTGNSCALAPQGSIPYQFYTKPGDDSLARVFKANGYRTVAMHPYPGYNWNRTKAYENLGFDEFLDLEYYDALEQQMELEKSRDYMSDRSDYEGIIRIVEEKPAGEKLFLFNVTMQNHGGYEVEGLEAQVHVTRLNGRECEGEFPKADQYLTLIRMSDEALRDLLQFFETWDEPTMIVMFGDHQPSVETPFFEALYGMRWSEVPNAEKLNSFITPYMIWTNYDRTAAELGNQSAFMLGYEVLREAGMTPSGFWKRLGELKDRYEAVHAMGAVERDGGFLDIEEVGNLDTLPGLHEFHILQYDRMFGKKK